MSISSVDISINSSSPSKLDKPIKSLLLNKLARIFSILARDLICVNKEKGKDLSGETSHSASCMNFLSLPSVPETLYCLQRWERSLTGASWPSQQSLSYVPKVVTCRRTAQLDISVAKPRSGLWLYADAPGVQVHAWLRETPQGEGGQILGGSQPLDL